MAALLKTEDIYLGITGNDMATKSMELAGLLRRTVKSPFVQTLQQLQELLYLGVMIILLLIYALPPV